MHSRKIILPKLMLKVSRTYWTDQRVGVDRKIIKWQATAWLVVLEMAVNHLISLNKMQNHLDNNDKSNDISVCLLNLININFNYNKNSHKIMMIIGMNVKHILNSLI